VSEIGGAGAEGASINVPLAPHTGDSVWLEAFERVVPEALERFRPDAYVLQLGADAHFGDPLAHLSLTSRGWMTAFERLLELSAGKPTVLTGGGGYNLETVRRLWSLVTAASAGVELPELHDTEAVRLADQSEPERFARAQVRELKARLGWGA
jgi:acetoin utilization protein AcuC